MGGAAVDAAGNVLFGGGVDGTLSLGGTMLTNTGFLAKLDCTGNPVWETSLPATMVGLAVDGSGATVAVGTFTGTVDFGTGPLTSPSANAIYVAKWDAAGAVLWSKGYTDMPSGARGDAIAVDTAGNVYFTGSVADTADFGGGPIGPGIAIVKLDPNGAHVWSKAVSATELAIAVDPTGGVVLAGTGMGANWVDGPLVFLVGRPNVAVAKLDATGAPIWSKAFTNGMTVNTPSLILEHVAVDPSGGILITGDLEGGNGIDFGGGPLAVSNNFEAFFGKLATDGTTVFTRLLGSWAPVAYTLGVGATSASIALLGGFSQTSVDFGGGPVMPAANGTIFVARYAPDGSFSSVDTYAASGTLGSATGAFDASGDVFFAGPYTGTYSFGASPLPNAPNGGELLVKLSP